MKNNQTPIDPGTWTNEHLWALGSVGPFGMVFYSEEKLAYIALKGLHPLLYMPQLKTRGKSFPAQTDSYNCGMMVIATLIDLVLTQWDKPWLLSDWWDINNSPQRAWKSHLKKSKFAAFIPKAYAIGTTFCSDPASALVTPGYYTSLCDNLRVELYILMQRLFAIFHQAFSAYDKVVIGTTWGALPEDYLHRLTNNQQIDHVMTKMTTSLSNQEELNRVTNRRTLRSLFVANGPSFLPPWTAATPHPDFFTQCVSQLPFSKDTDKPHPVVHEGNERVFIMYSGEWTARRKTDHDNATESNTTGRDSKLREREQAHSPTKKTGNSTEPIDLSSPNNKGRSTGGDGKHPSLSVDTRQGSSTTSSGKNKQTNHGNDRKEPPHKNKLTNKARRPPSLKKNPVYLILHNGTGYLMDAP